MDGMDGEFLFAWAGLLEGVQRLHHLPRLRHARVVPEREVRVVGRLRARDEGAQGPLRARVLPLRDDRSATERQ